MMGGGQTKSDHICLHRDCKYKVLTECPCVSFNDSCPGWGLILETEGGTQPEDECVEERLQKVRGWRALEGRSRKAEPLNKPPVHPGVSNPPAPHWGHQVSQWLCKTFWVLTPGAGNWRPRKERPPRNYLGFQVNALKIIPRAREQAGSSQQSLPSAFPPQPF